MKRSVVFAVTKLRIFIDFHRLSYRQCLVSFLVYITITDESLTSLFTP